MTDKHIKKITGFKVDKASEDELMDFSRYELVDIILAYREEYNELTRVHTKLNEKLKAKEQECKSLKEKLERQKDYTVCYKSDVYEQKKQLKDQLDQLKAENDELKEEIAKVRMEICNQCGEKDDYNIPCKQIRDLDYGLQLEIEENHKLKQTLTELGTILTHCMQQDICTTCDYSEECNLGDEEIPTYDICKFLLNKINQHQ